MKGTLPSRFPELTSPREGPKNKHVDVPPVGAAREVDTKVVPRRQETATAAKITMTMEGWSSSSILLPCVPPTRDRPK